MSLGIRGSAAVLVCFVLSAALGFAATDAQQPKRYDDHKIVRADLKTQAQFDALEATGAIILDCIPGVGPMTVLATPEQLTQIEKLGVTTRVVVENVQASVEAERAMRVRLDPFEDFFLDYHPYGSAGETSSIVWYMHELVARYPTLASVINIGTTLQGRTIWGLRVTNDAVTDKSAVLYFGAEHAREWITPPVPNYLAAYLLENYGTDPTATDLVDNVEFFLVPVFNVDGYIYSWTTERYWRKNRRNNGDGSYGVDINRNWGEGWGLEPGSSGVPSDETYRGTAPFSEPETQELRDFIIDHPNVLAQLDIHSFSQLILWPYGYKPELPVDEAAYEDVGYAMQSLIYGVHGLLYDAGPIYSGIYPVSGGSVDWTYAQRDIFSFSYELRPASGGLEGFSPPPDQIIPNCEEILPAVLHLTDSDWVRLPFRFRFPDGVPTTISAGTDTTIPVEIIAHSESILPGGARLYYRYDAGGSFIEIPLISLGGNLHEAVLPATNCTSTPEFYFSVSGDEGTTQTSPKQAPDTDVYSASVVGPDRVTFFTQPLNTNPGWTLQSQWAWGQPTGGGGEYGGPDPTSGHTGNYVYGYNLSGDYANGIGERYLTSTVIDCRGHRGVHLTFWRWLGVEQPAYDHASVSVNNGGGWVKVWENPTEIADTSWTFQEIDISGVADDQQTVFLRWTMGPTDSGWRYCGWNIDDIELGAAVCEAIVGDYNGDGDVDLEDFAQFANCFSGPGVQYGPGCGIFNFDADDDVDCDDWSSFEAAWTGPGEPPVFGPCGPFVAPTADAIAKNRYLSFTPGTSLGQPQAFRVTTVSNPLFPASVGEQKWAAAPSANNASRLACDPVYRLWDLTPLHVGDQDIVPGAAYSVEATLNGTEFLPPVAMATVNVWGDVVGEFHAGTQTWTAPNGVVDFNDISSMVDRFRGLPTAPAMARADLYPDVPNYGVNFDDISSVVDAFRGLPYPFAAPDPCP